MRTFQFSDARSHKFWSVEVRGADLVVTFGKIGTEGQTQTKTFPTPAKAEAEADKLVREKTKKGYVETTAAEAATDAERFEAALLANPDDLAGHCAFADYLAEQGDPRGEFMQVQIALEDETLPPDERKKLQAREKALLKKHKAAWVGEWADHRDIGLRTNEWSPPKGWVPYQFTRGLLTGVELGDLTVDVARLVVKSPQLRFVRRLTVRGIAFQEEGEYDEGPDTEDSAGEEPSQHVLVRWPQLRHVREFRFGGSDPADYTTAYNPYGCHTPADLTPVFAKQMPDIEVLHLMAHLGEEVDQIVSLKMPRLRSLLLYHGWRYPLEKLARNASLTNLEELFCHPHALEPGDTPYIRLSQLRAVCRSPHLSRLRHLQLRMADFGDEGITEVVSSGVLRRLQVLDIRHGLVTDAGARTLAACPDFKRMKHLDVRGNRLGKDGVAALKATGVSVATDAQQSPTADRWETFGQGDIE